MSRPEPSPLDRSAPELAAAVRTREVGARELALAAISRIDAQDGVLNAVVHLDADRALAEADAVDALAVDDPGALPPMAGVPTLVKDLHNAAGMPTTFGTRPMAAFTPPFDDEAVRRLRTAGFVLLGKTNVPEVGTLPWTEADLHGPARNPWDPDRTPGGSSGGAAAAVAAGYVPVAHASDGGGSIRIPAACCGVVGLKPARGRVSNAPLFGDQVLGFVAQGPVGRRVADVAAMLDAIHGYAPGDPSTAPPPPRPFAAEVGVDPGRRRIGVVEGTAWSTPDADVAGALRATADVLAGLGHEVEVLPLRIPAGATEQFLDVWSASIAATPLPHAQMEPHNQAFAARGRALSAPALLQAFTGLQLIARGLVDAMGAVDVVLAPVTATPAWPVGAHDGLDHDELTARLAALLGITPLVNVTGQAAVAVPATRVDLAAEVDPGGGGRPGRLPVGVQLIGGHDGEAALLRLASQLEAAVGWSSWRPPVDGAAAGDARDAGIGAGAVDEGEPAWR